MAGNGGVLQNGRLTSAVPARLTEHGARVPKRRSTAMGTSGRAAVAPALAPTNTEEIGSCA